MSSFPSYGQFRLLQFGVALGLLFPIIAFVLILRTGYYISDYITDVSDTNRLQREGTVTAVPLSGEARLHPFRSQWTCSLQLPDGRIVDYTRLQKPEGLTQLYFYEHPEITGTVSFPKYRFNSRGPNRQMIVEVPAHPDWDETFVALTESTYFRKTAILSTLTLCSLGSIWLAWQSYWVMKGGRRRRRPRHQHH